MSGDNSTQLAVNGSQSPIMTYLVSFTQDNEGKITPEVKPIKAEDQKIDGENKQEGPSLFTIPEVEIFAAGTWNGDSYSEKDLDGMVDVFKRFSKTLRPYLKLGHTENQKLIQKDGMPAAGWVDNLRRVGNKLVADFIDLPKKIYDLIAGKSYRKVSSEIYRNITIDGKKFPYMLSGVALLGSDTPAVTNLNDILSNFYKSVADKIEFGSIGSYTLSEADFEEKIMEDKNQDLEKLQGMQAERDELVKKLADAEAKNFSLECDKFMLDLDNQKLLLNSAKPFIQALIGPEKSTYSINNKELGKRELVKEILSIYSQVGVLSFSDKTEEGKQDNEVTNLSDMKKYIQDGANPRDAYLRSVGRSK